MTKPGFYRMGNGEDGTMLVSAGERLSRYRDDRFYRAFKIEYDPPPIPMRQFDYGFCHIDYDGPGDNRCGTARSVDMAKFDIDEMYDEGEV